MSDEFRTTVQEILGYRFNEASLLEEAFAHPSYAHEVDGSGGNERLEFLGDAVLDLVVAKQLYAAYPDWREGELTRARSSLVNTKALAKRSRTLGLGAFVKLGKTELRTEGHEKASILGNLFEAVVGAIYLDGGIESAEAFVARVFLSDLSGDALVVTRDPKTRFQEWAHVELRETPCYRTLSDSGIDDDPSRFEVEVLAGNEPWGRASGRNKREAERAAAQEALVRAEAGND